VKKGVPYFFVNTGKNELFAITDPENTQSQLVLLKNGFVKGKQTHDYGKPSELFCFQAISS
jgi:RimJ/RimL family protein N-acetyltransferase